MKHSRTLFLFLILFVSYSVSAQVTVSIADFGLEPNSRENATPFVNAAIQKCKEIKASILLFPKGRYDFWPDGAIRKDYFESNTSDRNPKRLALFFENMDSLVLDGDNSIFVMHDRMQPVTLDNCSNFTLKDFSIDWDIPLTAQGLVKATGGDWFDLQIDSKEFPYIFEDDNIVFVGEGWKAPISEIMEFTPDTRVVQPYTGDRMALGDGWNKDYTVKPQAENIVRFSKKGGYKRLPVVGNYLVLRHSWRDHAGIFLLKSKNLQLSDINVYHTAGLGILSQYSENLNLERVNVIPNKSKNRYLSGHDDGFHFMGCKGLIAVNNCEWAGLMDDPINIHGTCVRVSEIISKTEVKCTFMHWQSKALQWGIPADKIGLIENLSMRTLGFNTLKRMIPISQTEFLLEFENELPEWFKIGHAIENLSWTPDVKITNSRFYSCRARGLLITTPGKVLVEGNHFESSGSAILIAGDSNEWYESGAVQDVMIRNNVFTEHCMSSMYQFTEGIISICPEIPKADNKNPYHRNIRIEGNEFHPFDYPILYALSVDGLTFTNNKITRSHHIKPFHERKNAFTLESCKNVIITKNKLFGDVLGRDIRLVNMSRKEVKLSPKPEFKFTK